MPSCFRTGKTVVDFHFWICLETSEVFKEDELCLQGEEGLLRETGKEEEFPKNVKEVPKSLWVYGFREQREVELTSGKSPGEKSVHLPSRSRLGLKLSLIYRKQRNIIVLVLPEFADWDSYS